MTVLFCVIFGLWFLGNPSFPMCTMVSIFVIVIGGVIGRVIYMINRFFGLVFAYIFITSLPFLIAAVAIACNNK